MLLNASCPFDDASGKELLQWLSLQGITPEGSITGNIIPSQSDVFDIGSPTKRFANLYVDAILSPNGLAYLSVGNGATVLNVATGNYYQFNVNDVDIAHLDVGAFNPTTAGSLTLGDITKEWGDVWSIGDILLNALGKSVKVKSGVNGKAGTFTANGATEVIVNTTAWADTSTLSIGLKTVGGTPAPVFQSSSVPGTSFGITSVALNTSVYNYTITDLLT